MIKRIRNGYDQISNNTPFGDTIRYEEPIALFWQYLRYTIYKLNLKFKAPHVKSIYQAKRWVVESNMNTWIKFNTIHIRYPTGFITSAKSPGTIRGTIFTANLFKEMFNNDGTLKNKRTYSDAGKAIYESSSKAYKAIYKH